MARDIIKVIDTLIEQIDFTPRELARFRSLQDAAAYTAPEFMAHRWRRGAELLHDKFGEQQDGDALKARNIYVGGAA